MRESRREKKIRKVSFILKFNFNNSDETLGDQTGNDILHEIPHENPPLFQRFDFEAFINAILMHIPITLFAIRT